MTTKYLLKLRIHIYEDSAYKCYDLTDYVRLYEHKYKDNIISYGKYGFYFYNKSQVCIGEVNHLEEDL